MLNITDKVIKYAFIGSLLHNICYDIKTLLKKDLNFLNTRQSDYRTKYLLNNGMFYGAFLAFFSYYYEKPVFSSIIKKQ